MRCETTSDPHAFWAQVSEFLLGDPVVNNVMVTVVSARRAGAVDDAAPATYATVFDDAGAVVGAAMRTPPYAVYVSPMAPAAVATLAETMVDCCPDATGVTGTAPEADAFAGEWARRTGARVALHMRQRMHRLSEVAEVGSVPGIWRPAALPDRDLLVEWSEAFHIEANEGPAASMAADVDLRLAQGRAFVWVDGTPVSYVGTAGAAGSVVRVGPVYTPPDRRGHGYASALVAAVSRDALYHGATACMLYTDVANRTSNAIYFAIGYRPVCDVIAYHFNAGPG